MLKTLRIIHYTAGLIGSLLVLLMSITGILLNHRTLIGYSSNTAYELQNFIFALHSGNVGNASIIWLTDLGAICMIVLSISGVWMWVNLVFRKRRKNNDKKNLSSNNRSSASNKSSWLRSLTKPKSDSK